jgi:hypothetical protein
MPHAQTLALLSTYPPHSLCLGQAKAVALSTLTPLARAWTAILDLAHGLPEEGFAEALLQALPYLPPHTVLPCLRQHLAEPQTAFKHCGVLVYRPSYEQVFVVESVSLVQTLCQASPHEPWQLFALSNQALRWHLQETAQPSGCSLPSGHTEQGLHRLVPAACYLLNHWVQGGESLAFLKQAGTQLELADTRFRTN